MSSKMRILCFTLLLLFSVASFGIAAADDKIYPVNDPIADYQHTVYINDNVVTIEMDSRHSISHYNFTFKPFDEESDPIHNTRLKPTQNIIQFEVAGSGEYVIQTCMHGGSIQKGNNLTFVAEQLYVDEDRNPTDDEINGIENFVIYPISGNFSNTCGIPAYYSSDYTHIFSEDEFYPNLTDELTGSHSIYRFYGGNLRSISWYDVSDPNVLDYNLNPYSADFTVNMSSLPDVDINYIFICPEHDNITYNRIVQYPAGASDCGHVLEWNVFVNDELRESSQFLKSFIDKYPDYFDEGSGTDEESANVSSGNEINCYSHYVSFNDLNALNRDLLNTRNVNLSFYPLFSLNIEEDKEEDEGNEKEDNNDEESDSDEEGSTAKNLYRLGENEGFFSFE